MPSVHVIRWIENLNDTNHEIYWFDVLGKGKLQTIYEIKQFTNWRKRKIPYIKGEYWLSKNVSKTYKFLKPFLETTPNEALEKIILELKPDLIHSFEMQSCSYPILETMLKFSKIKWIYSCWGSDLYFYSKLSDHRAKIEQVLNRIDYLITDCNRDLDIALQNGFQGKFLGVIPGGTGFDLEKLQKYKLTIQQRKIILIKGYEHKFGRALNVLKAVHELKKELKEYKIVVFGAHESLSQYITLNKLDYTIYDRHGLSHQNLLELMGKSLIYMGNSISDGMPNTLLEAIVMGAFPIQSNPGNVTSEIIENNINGLLINNPESIPEIKKLLLLAINNPEMIVNAIILNEKLAKEKLEYFDNQQKIINLYADINNNC